MSRASAFLAIAATDGAEHGDIGGVDDDVARARADADDAAVGHDPGRELAGLVGDDAQLVRAVVDELADGVEVALGEQPALAHHEHPRRQPFDLVEHVRRHDDGAALLAELREQVDHVAALARVEAFERFVEHDDVGLVHERGRDLHPLAHALGIGADRPGIVGVELDEAERARGRPSRLGDVRELGAERDELERGQDLGYDFLLRHEAEVAEDFDVAARVLAEQADRARATATPVRTACASPSTCRRRWARAAR